MAPPATQRAEPRPPLGRDRGTPGPVTVLLSVRRGVCGGPQGPTEGCARGAVSGWPGPWPRAFGPPGALSGPVKIINFPRLALERARERIPVIYNLAVLSLMQRSAWLIVL